MTVQFELDPAVAPPSPRDAATVLVLRDGPDGPEVFLVRRTADARFMGGAYVFPGGRVDPGDADPAVPCDLTPEEAAARLGEDDPARARALYVAAIRECVEEAGILLATGNVTDPVIDALRAALSVRGAPPIASLLAPYALRLDARALVPFARWVTPRAETKRFDARFFLVRAPADTRAARHDGSETVDSAWMTPRAAIERALRDEIVLAPPTWRTLAELTPARSVDEAMALAPAAITPREPAVALDDGVIHVVFHDDPDHPDFEDIARPHVPVRFRYLEGAWRPARRT